MGKYTQIFNDSYDYRSSNNKLTNGEIKPDEPFLGLVPPNKVIYSNAVDLITNGYEYVDLGLPSGTLWATMNIGAADVGQRGDYFSWGELSSKSNYTWETYRFGTENNITKYNATDGKTTLDIEDDAANFLWGGSWHIPTPEQIYELIQNTSWDNESGVKIYVSNFNGNKLYLWEGGEMNGEMDETTIAHLTKYNYEFLSNTLASDFINVQHFGDDGEGNALVNYPSQYAGFRYRGFQIRPVMNGLRHTYNEPPLPER